MRTMILALAAATLTVPALPAPWSAERSPAAAAAPPAPCSERRSVPCSAATSSATC